MTHLLLCSGKTGTSVFKRLKNISFSKRVFPIKGKLHHFIVYLAFALLVFGTTLSYSVTAETIQHTKSNDPRETLVLQILKLALSKNENSNQYDFSEYHTTLTEARLFEMVKDNTLTIMWAGTQLKYEEELIPIRIPVLKGMLGHRIFIIRNGDQGRFDQVSSFSQLQQIPLGQGRYWGDTKVLQHSQMNVVAPVKYESLFHMLEGERFDFFPRAIHEPWSEVETRSELNLTVEKNLLLVYPFAMYFFVNKESSQLANNIENGFMKAIDDGSYDQLFFSHPMISNAITSANLSQRTVFHLDNPNMSAQTPVNDKRLWLDLENL